MHYEDCPPPLLPSQKSSIHWTTWKWSQWNLIGLIILSLKKTFSVSFATVLAINWDWQRQIQGLWHLYGPATNTWINSLTRTAPPPPLTRTHIHIDTMYVSSEYSAGVCNQQELSGSICFLLSCTVCTLACCKRFFVTIVS